MAIGMHQRGRCLESAGRVARQWGHAREHAVLVGRYVQQHHRQRRLIKILGVVGCHAHAYGAAPVGHLGQFTAQVIEKFLCVAGVMVRDVEQAQRGGRRIFGQGHLGPQLRQHQGGGHAPLGVGGMASGK